MKTIISAILGFLLLAAPAAVQAQYTYTTNADNTLTITNYTGAGGVVIIPAATNGLAVTVIGNGTDPVFGSSATNVTIPDGVTTIGQYAFENCYYMTNVTIPDSVTSIGDYAFEDCEQLAGITIPDGVTSIGYETFYYCTNLGNLTFPDSVTSIEDYAFEDCFGLKNVTIGPNVTSIGSYAFEDCGISNLMIGTNGTITNGGCAIAEYAFEECYGMQNVMIGSSVTSIGYEAFEYCYMTNLTIGTNVTSPGVGCAIAEYAFYDCRGLTNVTIGNSVTSIGYEAFEDCYMTNLTIGANGPSPNGGCSIGYEAFYDCSMTNLTIGNNVTSIGEYAFDDCYDLTNVTIGNNSPSPNGGCSIGYEAFYDCSMTTLTLGNNVTSIGDYAFEDCYNLRTLTLGTNVTSIGYEAFYDCYKLTNAIISSGAIAEYAFEDCEDLTNPTIGPNVTSIGYEAFEYCTNLGNLTIPDSVTGIGDYAFEDCYDLTNVTIGKGVTSVGYEVFSYCYDLTNVTFGPNVGAISEYAFYYCTNLTGLYFQGNAPAVASTAFIYWNGSKYVNSTNVTVYYYAGATGWGSTFDGFPTVELSPNSLQVTLGPTTARDDGAQWQLDGGINQNGVETTLANLPPGSHTVSFTPISGWITPSSQTVTITNGEAASVVGLYTPTNTPGNGLILLTNGYGTISHSAWPKILVAGKKYKVTAAPDLKNLFAFWTGGTNQPYAVLSASAGYTFTMESNLVLAANFITNPFTGIYNGLFSVSNGVTEETAGMLEGLTIGTKRTYSGKVLINGGSHAITGSFNSAGRATNLIARPASQGGPLLVEMTLMTSDNSAPQVIGTVSGTNNGVPWVADNLQADLAANTLPSAQYTMLILPDTNNAPPSASPGGDGYALITNYAGTAKNPASAKAKITGALADGTTFSQSVPVSQNGYAPVYASLYSKRGLLLGWINLDSSTTAGVGLTWIHPALTTGLYKNGFTNTLLASQIPLSLWTNPPPNLDLLTNLLTADVINATNAVNIAVMTSASGQITGTSVSGSIAPKTGLLKVTIGGGGASKVTGYGAILLNATNGGGYFLTETNAQAIELGP